MRGLYLHIPFCVRACPYCDFDFEVARSPAWRPYVAALGHEADARGLRGPFDTVYLGGGTPSALGPAGLTEVLSWVAARFPGSGAAETTVECNPEHVDAALLDVLVGGGVSRVSLGVQSLDPVGLRQLGRAHRPEEAVAAVHASVQRGLRVTADLIVGWPGQHAASLAHDVDGIVEAGARHVSLYALTVEAGTPWTRLVTRGTREVPDPDAQADRLVQAEEALLRRGLGHYEIASYAVPGEEAVHNRLYWTWHDYVGLGPSAGSATYGHDGVRRRSNARGYAAWRAGGPAEEEVLAREAAAAEGLWLGLRQLDGFARADFLDRFGVGEDWLDARLASVVANGLVASGATVRAQPGAWLLHDTIGRSVLDEATGWNR